MNIEEKIQNKIKELIDNVNNTIPVPWDRVFINASISETGGRVYFFFKAVGNDDLYYSLLIPKDFNVDTKQFEANDLKNYFIAKELWGIFKDNNMEVWKNASFVYRDNKLSIDFDYVDWNLSSFGPTDCVYFFRYKYIGIPPKDEEQAKLFNDMEAYYTKFS